MSEIDWSKARLKKISIRIDRHSTSISLEPYFIDILKACAKKSGVSFNAFITMIDAKRPIDVNLSAALRIFALHLIKKDKID